MDNPLSHFVSRTHTRAWLNPEVDEVDWTPPSDKLSVAVWLPRSLPQVIQHEAVDPPVDPIPSGSLPVSLSHYYWEYIVSTQPEPTQPDFPEVFRITNPTRFEELLDQCLCMDPTSTPMDWVQLHHVHSQVVRRQRSFWTKKGVGGTPTKSVGETPTKSPTQADPVLSDEKMKEQSLCILYPSMIKRFFPAIQDHNGPLQRSMLMIAHVLYSVSLTQRIFDFVWTTPATRALAFTSLKAWDTQSIQPWTTTSALFRRLAFFACFPPDLSPAMWPVLLKACALMHPVDERQEAYFFWIKRIRHHPDSPIRSDDETKLMLDTCRQPNDTELQTKLVSTSPGLGSNFQIRRRNETVVIMDHQPVTTWIQWLDRRDQFEYVLQKLDSTWTGFSSGSSWYGRGVKDSGNDWNMQWWIAGFSITPAQQASVK